MGGVDGGDDTDAGEGNVRAVEADVAAGLDGELVFGTAAGGVDHRKLTTVEISRVRVVQGHAGELRLEARCLKYFH